MTISLDELRERSKENRSVQLCPVAVVFNSLDPEDVAVIEEGLAEDQQTAINEGRLPITNAGIAKAINAIVPASSKVTWQAVRNHRVRCCSCKERR